MPKRTRPAVERPTDDDVQTKTSFSASEVRSAFSIILSRVAFGRERIYVTKNGKRVASFQPIEPDK